MQAPGIPSVDQLLVLLSVVEEGSFTGADTVFFLPFSIGTLASSWSRSIDATSRSDIGGGGLVSEPPTKSPTPEVSRNRYRILSLYSTSAMM